MKLSSIEYHDQICSKWKIHDILMWLYSLKKVFCDVYKYTITLQPLCPFLHTASDDQVSGGQGGPEGLRLHRILQTDPRQGCYWGHREPAHGLLQTTGVFWAFVFYRLFSSPTHGFVSISFFAYFLLIFWCWKCLKTWKSLTNVSRNYTILQVCWLY